MDCVESIFRTDYDNYEVIVVDNLSNDESHKKCKAKFEKILLIENTENLGYCEGNNVGIRKAKGDFIVILNPDTLVEPNWLTELISTYKKFGDGLYQPKIIATTDRKMLLSTGQMLNLFGFGYSRGKGDEDKKQYENVEQVGYASGTCLFTSADTMKRLGMFDSFLFAYHDDLDLGWRGIQRGIKSYYVPTAVIYHPVEGYSFKWSNFKFFLLERNRQYCLLTHYSRSTYYKMLPALILVDVVVFLFYLRKGIASAKIKAHFDIIKNWYKVQERYKEIQSTRTQNDKEIIRVFSDELLVPRWVVNDVSNKLFNGFIRMLSSAVRRFV
ncbi:MAG: glycosyltransferase family 2 protein [Candidatus Nitrosotenuis sp.]